MKNSIRSLFSKTLKNPGLAIETLLKELYGQTHTLIPSVFNPSRPGNIAMFHTGRCGSTVLGNLLGKHPGIFWDEEIYRKLFYLKNPGTNGNPEFVVKNSDMIGYLMNRMKRGGSRYYGMETKFSHLDVLGMELKDYIRHLKDCGFDRFIVLRRKNTLRVVVSNEMAKIARRYHRYQNEKTRKTVIHLDLENIFFGGKQGSFFSYVEYEDRMFQQLEKLLSSQRLLHLWYEQDIRQDPYVGFLKVCDFLELNTETKPSIQFGITNPFPLDEIISNFKEVKQKLIATKYQWMLYD